jgi:hypothetical protein
MAWENIQERLQKAFKVKVAFPTGTIWLPDAHLDINEWLTSAAETDEELKELNIPRIRFLQNRWSVEELLEFEWKGRSPDRRAVFAMYVGRRAYILFSGAAEYQVIAAIEPKSEPTLYRAVIGKFLQNPNFIPECPANIKNHRPDLVPTIILVKDSDVHKLRPVFGGENFGGLGGPNWMHPGSQSRKVQPKEGYLSKFLVGWIGNWIDLPVLGFWHEDVPSSIATSGKGKYVMKYKPTYGDKQREKQKRQSEQRLENRRTPTQPTQNVEGGPPDHPVSKVDPKDKNAA